MTPVTLRTDALACHAAAVAAVEPGALVARGLARSGGRLHLVARNGTALAEHGGPVLVDILTQPLQDAKAPVSEWVA